MLAAMPPTTSPTPANGDGAPVRDRADACPGALRLHPADDGRLARLRLPAGILTYRQARLLATVAERLGDGHLDITSRGNIQLRGLGESCGAELADLLHGAGLLPSEAHERVRNIVASPLAGLDGTVQRPGADVQVWARRLDELLCASAAATALSGRFLFALDDGGGDMAGLGADVMLLAQGTRDAQRTQGTQGTQGDRGTQDARGAQGADADTAVLYIGTNRPERTASGPLFTAFQVAAADAPKAALIAAETFLTVAAATGPGAWRVRELPPGHGLGEAVAAGLAEAGIAAEPTSPPPDLPEAGPPPPGPVTAGDGTTALSVYAPLGRLTAGQWRLLTTGGGSGELRVTPWRGVIVPGLDPAGADVSLDRLRAAGLITTAAAPSYGVSACTGRPGCAKALTDVRSDAAAAIRAMAATRAAATGAVPDTTTTGSVPDTTGTDAVPGARPVHWSGCARRCGRPAGGPGGGHVDVVATADDSYEISVRGRLLTTAAGPELAAAVATARTTTVTR
ncbi:cobalamin biosynthesis protein CobG [Streptomyces hebeiensis]